ncbi:hypothetical protein K435DRAFT_820353 [Dendrothele bispora CBS 962.96]|uniref:Uncharacterized protein n=1 Tax=Dendrothele bispora (strain CBS 962.96) TaxID=1314807 RepID=A0A4V4HF09_DENBC|nr:hypothetical protein K435DRAFT_820353 [Dendrothele bispora CBS 962.96]
MDRFEHCPAFGRCTIRHFTDDTTSMKRIAARDFEDILQCCPSIFCGLFPNEIGGIVQDLLFVMAAWHALAKLRLHSETSLQIFEGVTRELGFQLRRFKTDVSLAEKAAKAVVNEVKVGSTSKRGNEKGKKKKQGTAKIQKTFNLSTYKIHALPDYPAAIRRMGTTDNFTSQIVGDFTQPFSQ